MVRQFKVLIVFLFLACLFCSSAYADFSNTDSSNLSQIRSYVSTIQSYTSTISSNISSMRTDLSTIRSYAQNLSDISLDVGLIESTFENFSRLFTNSTNGWNAMYNLVYSLTGKSDTTNSYLQQILSALGGGLSVDDRNVVYTFDSRFQPSDRINKDAPFLVYTPATIDWNCIPPVFLDTGTYYLVRVINSYQTSYEIRGYTAGNNLGNNIVNTGDFSVRNFTFNGVSLYLYVSELNIDEPYYISRLIMSRSSPSYSAAFIVKADDSDVISSENVPLIDSSESDLSDGITQLDQQEDEIFTNLDTSIGDLDFSGSALGQVVSGFTFIRAVFSAIYSSSPYISVLINLSCMLGVLAIFLRVQPRFSRWEREHRDRTS